MLSTVYNLSFIYQRNCSFAYIKDDETFTHEKTSLVAKNLHFPA